MRTINCSVPVVSMAQMPVLLTVVTPAVLLALSVPRKLNPPVPDVPAWSASARAVNVAKVAPAGHPAA